MSNSVLVTYASRTGSTVGVAEAIGQALTEGGAAVTVQAMEQVTDLGPYQAVVAGSAIQAGQWLPEAMQFVRDHRAALNAKPCATFLVCMTLAMKNSKMRDGADVGHWLEPVRALITPVSEGLFAGHLDISQVPSFSERLKFRASVLAGVWEEGDHRDWAAIKAWASGLLPLFQARLPH